MSSANTDSEPKQDALASLRINREVERRPSGKGWKWLVGLVLLGIVVWFGFGKFRESGAISRQSEFLPEIMQKRVEVRLVPVTVQRGRSADAVVVATGYLESRRQARIGARAAGRIDKVLFEEGDRVEKDQGSGRT